MKPQYEIADILRKYGDEYQEEPCHDRRTAQGHGGNHGMQNSPAWGAPGGL